MRLWAGRKAKRAVIAGPHPALYVGSSPIHGRGVFSNRVVKRGGLIEACPVIRMKLGELSGPRRLALNYYAFMVDEKIGEVGVALGYGSLYNHAEDHNAAYYYDREKDLMIFEARRAIAPHEEITIDYLGPDPGGKTIDSWVQSPDE